MKNSTKRGFTMIELMVSVAIIGILAALITINISNIKSKNRDAKRMMNVQEISKALGLYNNNTNLYPIYTGNITSSDAMSIALETANTIPEVPVDPLNTGVYVYSYTSTDGTDYSLGFCLETDTIHGYSQGCGNTITP